MNPLRPFVQQSNLHEQREEREANEFAEALIFGDGALKAALGLYGRDEAMLARHFGVSVRALQIALGKL